MDNVRSDVTKPSRFFRVAFLITLVATVYVWVRPIPCSGLATTDAYENCHKIHGVLGSEIGTLSLRVLLSATLCVVALKATGVNVMPVITLFGLCVASASFALKDILSDYVSGLGMLIGGVITYNDHVVLSVNGRGEPTAPLRIDRFHLFFIEATSIDRTSAPSKVFIRYSQIQRIDRLVDLPKEISKP